ncbi:MAG: glutathione S-transferase family protein [Deltaproteobacteria bacterium]|nr:glutathione S-transferase family protein [Deltaproteobacteria bacterium]
MSDLVLHHNSMSSCSQKVRLVLAEKGLAFESREVDLISGQQHAPEYVALNPNHVVPTLVHDGHVLIESSLIDEYLADAFPEVALAPRDPAAGVLTYAIGARPVALLQPAEAREAAVAAIPDPARRAARRSVLEHGVAAPEFAGALAAFLDLIDAMEAKLAPGGWLSGDRFGLADAAALPYVLRLEHLAMTPLLEASARPRVADWLARVKARPSYATAVGAWLPAPLVDLFQKHGAAVWGEVEQVVSAHAAHG